MTFFFFVLEVLLKSVCTFSVSLTIKVDIECLGT
jgi:hypothetical protein